MAASPSTSPIVYFHVDACPRYLRYALESARFFNPDSPIFLITNKKHALPAALRIEVRTTASLGSARLDAFEKSYVHISATRERYERFCIARWFYLEELRRTEGFARAAYFDSDAMLFHRVDDLFGLIPSHALLACSKGVMPAVTLVQNALAPFLDMILGLYGDAAFLAERRARCEAAIAQGGMDNVTDMSFFQLFTARTDGLGAIYPNTSALGHIDHCIYANPDGIDSAPNRRHISRKRIFWEDRDGVFRPRFRVEATGAMVPALSVHFQGGAKRWMRRFNHVGGGFSVPRALRLRYYNWLLN